MPDRSFGHERRRIASRSDNCHATADEVGHERVRRTTLEEPARVSWFTRQLQRKCYRRRYARACAPVLLVGSGAHGRDHTDDCTGGRDLGAVFHRMIFSRPRSSDPAPPRVTSRLPAQKLQWNLNDTSVSVRNSSYRAGAAATVHRPAPMIVVAMPSFIVDPA
jgi:hypothetical protein